MTFTPEDYVGAVALYGSKTLSSGTQITVKVDRASWLHLACKSDTSGGLGALAAGVPALPTSDWEEVSEGRSPEWTGSGTTIARRRLLPASTFVALPATSSTGECLVAVRSLESGRLGGCDSARQFGSVLWKHRRVCARSQRFTKVSDGQCVPTTLGDQDKVWVGQGGADGCWAECVATPGCRFFTAHGDGACAFHRRCDTPDYPCRGLCATFALSRARGAELAFWTPPPALTQVPEGEKKERVSVAFVAAGGQASWYPERAGFPFPSHEWTVEAWVRVAEEGCGNPGCAIFSVSDTVAFELTNDATSSRLWFGSQSGPEVPTPVGRGVWRHVGVSWDGERGEVVVDGGISSEFRGSLTFHAPVSETFRLGQWFPNGVPDPSRAFSGELQQVRVWATARPVSALFSCSESSVGPHPKLVASWPLQGDLEDESGRRLDLVPHRRPVWFYTWGSGPKANPDFEFETALTPEDCGAACGAHPGCRQWNLNASSGEGVCTGFRAYNRLSNAVGGVSGSAGVCPGFSWDEERDSYSALPSSPTSLALADPPNWWVFYDAVDSESCSLFCAAERLCEEYTWVDANYADSKVAGRCFGIGASSRRNWVKRAGHKSGRGRNCPRWPPLVRAVRVDGGLLLSESHARRVCATVGASPSFPRSGQELVWMLEQATVRGYSNTSIAVGVTLKGSPRTFSRVPASVGAAVQASGWDLGPTSPFEFDVVPRWWGGTGGRGIAAWERWENTPWLLCQVPQEGVWTGRRAGLQQPEIPPPVCAGSVVRGVTRGGCAD
eukprot:Hpha_TRINITY_DN16658_c3_g8::TRINITY_DN16658_c3_g8_i1::g.183479::m.183479